MQHWAYVSYIDLSLMDGQRAHIHGFINALTEIAHVTMINPSKPSSASGIMSDYVQIRYPKQKVPVVSYSSAIVHALTSAHRSRQFDHLYLRSIGGYSDLVALLWAKAVNVPTVIEVNGLLSEEYTLTKSNEDLNWRVKLSIYFNLSLLRIIYRVASKVVAVTDNIRDYLISRYGVNVSAVRTFSNGVDTRLFFPMDTDACKSLVGLPQDRRYIGFVGSLKPWQGVDDLLYAFQAIATLHSDWCLLIIGSGDQENKLKQITEQLKLSNSVYFVGQVSHETVVKYVNACDVVTVPKKPLGSGYSPMKVYEYLACGKPVVASHLPGLEFIHTEGVGATFHAQEREDLTKSLLDLMSLPASERQIMSDKARQVAVERYSWDKIVREVMAFSVGK